VKKSVLPLMLVAILMVLGLTACGENAGDTQSDMSATTTEQAVAQETAAAQPANPNAWQGKVMETMDAGGYTYVHIDTGSEQIWAAGPVTPVKVGQEMSIDKGMPMQNFHSKALERDFDMIYFVGSFPGADQPANPHGGMGGMGGTGDATGGGHSVVEKTEVSSVAKADGGYTVEEIFTQSAQLSGKPVKVRGQVVKFTANIMGTNWAHIQDGTGSGATGDLTVTTSDMVAVGDIVVVEGSLTVDKDFGAGYKYAAIVEGAKLTKE